MLNKRQTNLQVVLNFVLGKEQSSFSNNISSHNVHIYHIIFVCIILTSASKTVFRNLLFQNGDVFCFLANLFFQKKILC